MNLQLYSRIHVIDSDPNSDVNKLQQQHQQHQEEEEEEKSEIEEGDVAGFTEFQLLEEDYKTRQNSVLNWKKSINWVDLILNFNHYKKNYIMKQK